MKSLICLLMYFAALPLFSQSSRNGTLDEINYSSICSDTRSEQVFLKYQLNKSRTKHLQSDSTPITFILPIRQHINYSDPGYYGISRFVDHDLNFPDQVLDYNCSDRTYDRSNGYNHSGTDFFSWPYGWTKMNNNAVYVVAAADGKIIFKEASNYDKNCRLGEEGWNVIFLEHSDGTVTWYGHMKQNSLTQKREGEMVRAGEYLGVVGSSGGSTGPHLHFEVFDAAGNMIDPFAGDCNETTERSWWESQSPYHMPSVNKLMTQTEAPQLGCYEDEFYKAEVNFRPDQKIYFTTFYRDRLEGSHSQYKVYLPDGSIFSEWEIIASRSAVGSYYWRSYDLTPEESQPGQWTYEVTHDDKVYTHTFYIANDSIGTFSLTPPSTCHQTADNILASFKIKNESDHLGLIVDSVKTEGGLDANWHGVIHAGKTKTIYVQQNMAPTSPSGTVTVYTKWGNQTLELFDNQKFFTEDSKHICMGDSIVFGDQVITHTGLYAHTFTDIASCDSTVYMDVEVSGEIAAVDLNDDFGITSIVASEDISYQWHDCQTNTPIFGANAPSFFPEKTGSYYVVTSQNGCEQNSACISIEIPLATVSSTTRIYPNPTDGLVAVTFHQEFTGSISIFNLSGKLIFSDSLSQSKSYQRQLSANAGTYMLILKSDTGETERLKLQIKN